MTLEEAGKMYLNHKKKIDDVNETSLILRLTIDAAKSKDAPCTTCTVRTDILERAATQLEGYFLLLKDAMEKEMH